MARRPGAREWPPTVSFCVSTLVVTAAVWACARMLQTTPGVGEADAALRSDTRGADRGSRVSIRSWTWTAPEGDVIAGVRVEAGSAALELSADAAIDCWSVRGIGTPTVRVTGAGARSCAEIS